MSCARPENNVRAVQSEFEQMRISHNYERMVTIAIIVIVVLVLLTIIATLYSWYRNYKGRARAPSISSSSRATRRSSTN